MNWVYQIALTEVELFLKRVWTIIIIILASTRVNRPIILAWPTTETYMYQMSQFIHFSMNLILFCVPLAFYMPPSVCKFSILLFYLQHSLLVDKEKLFNNQKHP